jgi:hypothetical protein
MKSVLYYLHKLNQKRLNKTDFKNTSVCSSFFIYSLLIVDDRTRETRAAHSTRPADSQAATT